MIKNLRLFFLIVVSTILIILSCQGDEDELIVPTTTAGTDASNPTTTTTAAITTTTGGGVITTTTTAAIPIKVEVTDILPKSGAQDVSVSQDIIITFDGKLYPDPSAGSILFNGNPIPINRIIIDDYNITIKPPSSGWAKNTTYNRLLAKLFYK